jgi:hypothetical protein
MCHFWLALDAVLAGPFGRFMAALFDICGSGALNNQGDFPQIKRQSAKLRKTNRAQQE